MLLRPESERTDEVAKMYGGESASRSSFLDRRSHPDV